MATECPYDVSTLKIDDTDVLDDVGGKANWIAKTSALETNTCYEFVSGRKFEYMDFKDRYLVEKITDSKRIQNRSDCASSEKSVADNEILQKDVYLAYCFTVKMQDQDLGEGSHPPTAIQEDIIADVMLMKGQSMLPGFEKMQIFKDVCISVDGMVMNHNKSYQDVGSYGANQNEIQVMLIHEQIPDMEFQDNLSETVPDWEQQVDFNHLDNFTIMEQRDELIANQNFLPLIAKIVTMVGQLSDQYFYEFEL